MDDQRSKQGFNSDSESRSVALIFALDPYKKELTVKLKIVERNMTALLITLTSGEITK